MRILLPIIFLLAGQSSAALAASSPPPIPYNQPGGPPALNASGKLPSSTIDPPTTLRGPTAADAASTFAVNALWNVPPNLWTLNDSTAGAAQWQYTPAPALLPWNAAGNPTGVAYSCSAKLNALYTGKACALAPLSTLTPFDVGFIGNAVDYASADAVCAGSTNSAILGTGCIITKRYNQASTGASNGLDETNANLQLMTAAVNGSGGSGYTNNNPVAITLANTGGTCSQSTVVSAKIASGSIAPINSSNGLTVTTPGVCSVPPTQPQTIASCSPSCGSGTGGTFNIVYGSQAPIWNPANSFNGLRASVFGGYQYAAGGYQVLPVYMTIPSGFSFTMNNSTWAFVYQAPTDAAPYPLLTTNDGNYGYWTGSGNAMKVAVFGATTAGNEVAADNCGVNSEQNPELLVASYSSGTVTCYVGNASGTKSPATSPGAQTGAIEGSTSSTVSIFNNYATYGITTPLNAAQTLAFRQSNATVFGLRMQAQDFLLDEGGSLTSGRATMLAGSPTNDAASAFKYPIGIFNAAQSGQALSTIISAFLGATGDAQFYRPYARSFTASYAGLVNDIAALEGNGNTAAQNAAIIHGLLANYVYQWKTLPTTGQVPVKVLLGLLPLQCNQQSDSVALAMINIIYPDMIANATVKQPGTCNTTTACESGGLGADGFFNVLNNATIGGCNALTGGCGGAYPLLSSPNVPFCSTTYAVAGQHATDAAQVIIGNYKVNAANALLP
jgi:hypothetical protein